jgi:acyl-coenzyme A thioesterase 7
MTTSTTKADEAKFFKSAELSRWMVPADANVAGNVHGGTIMQMIEESACVAASRFFNHFSEHSSNQQKFIKVLTARVESITFQKPLHVGDVAKVQAQVVFASEHTVAVAVKLMAERLACKEDAVGNRALLWIVGHVDDEGSSSNDGSTQSDGMTKDHLGIARVKTAVDPSHFRPAKAPKLDPPTDGDDKEAIMAYKLASLAYKSRKAHEQNVDLASLPDSDMMNDEHGKPSTKQQDGKEEAAFFSPDDSAVELAQVMLPADCVTGAGLVRGGVVMKLMDNASGVAAVRHCGTNVVTVSVDAMDLVAPVLLGDVLRIRARPVFTSGKSIEIEVKVVAERFSLQDDGTFTRKEIVFTKQAYFTFVSLGSSEKALPMRPLVPKTEEDKKRFQQGKERYERRKALRSAGAKKQ